MVKGKHNYKLSEEDKKEIVTSYYLNKSKENVQDLCDRFGISNQWLYKLVKSNNGQEILNNKLLVNLKACLVN